MAISITLNTNQLIAFAEIILGLIDVDPDFEFLGTDEITDILRILSDEKVPTELSAAMDEFHPDRFDMEETCERLIAEEIVSNDVINLLLQVIQVDEYFDAKEHEYISEIADLIGAELEELEIELVESIVI